MRESSCTSAPQAAVTRLPEENDSAVVCENSPFFVDIQVQIYIKSVGEISPF